MSVWEWILPELLRIRMMKKLGDKERSVDLTV